MSIFKTTKLINFHNNTSEVIIIEAWTDVMPGLSSFKSKILYIDSLSHSVSENIYIFLYSKFSVELANLIVTS